MDSKLFLDAQFTDLSLCRLTVNIERMYNEGGLLVRRFPLRGKSTWVFARVEAFLTLHIKAAGSAVPALPAMPNSQANRGVGGTRMQEIEAHLGENLHLIIRSPGPYSKFELMCWCWSTEHSSIGRSNTPINCRVFTCNYPVDSGSWASGRWYSTKTWRYVAAHKWVLLLWFWYLRRCRHLVHPNGQTDGHIRIFSVPAARLVHQTWHFTGAIPSPICKVH